MMLYSFGHPMQLCCTLLYSHVSSRSNFPGIPLLTKPREIFFANFVSCVLAIFVFGCAFLSFFNFCLLAIVLQSLRWILG